jgi:glycosyltransferase involved in cell wall biosynthesis
MAQRKYTIAELEQMRKAVAGMLHLDSLIGTNAAQISLLVETHLHTHILNGTDPDELTEAARAWQDREANRVWEDPSTRSSSAISRSRMATCLRSSRAMPGRRSCACSRSCIRACAALLADVAEQASRFDVIHSHIEWVHLPLLQRFDVPFLTTLHVRLDVAGLDQVLDRFQEAPFVSISNDQRRPLPNVRWLATVYHGLPKDSLKPSYERGGYLAFLGRLAPEKGPDVAIRVAQRANVPLRIAAKLPRRHSRYFKERLQPLIEGSRTELVGEVDDSRKEGFLQNATALLFPIDWPEPFGLVMIEAMACGTPVIAYRRGSVPEVIENGLTGFVVDNEEEAIAAVGRLHELDRRSIRAAFEKRFTARRMAQDYVCHYRELTRHAPRADKVAANPITVATLATGDS